MSKTAQKDYGLLIEPKCVIALGPIDIDGYDYEFQLMFGDNEGEPIENAQTIWKFNFGSDCQICGQSIARKYGLEFVNDMDLV